MGLAGPRLISAVFSYTSFPPARMQKRLDYFKGDFMTRVQETGHQGP